MIHLPLTPITVALLAASACKSDATPPRELVFAPAHLPEATVGQPYLVTITVSNNTTPVFLLSSSALPAGLTFEPKLASGVSTAEIGGTPIAAGHTTLTIEASCYGTQTSGQTGTHLYELIVH